MTAIDWIRTKAQAQPIETVAVSGESGLPAGRYHVETRLFRGVVPARMKRSLIAARLDQHDLRYERVIFPDGRRGRENYCEYTAVEYRPV